MARGIQKWNEDTITRLKAAGRGKGTGAQYLPWINVFDLSSRGRSRRVFSRKTGREHHLFSDVEWNTFLLLEWTPDVVDIREQYPLDRDITTQIAAARGIAHPCYPGTHISTVMTVDFLVTRVQNGKYRLEAFNDKRTDEAEDKRSLAKLEIQRAYFDGMQIPHWLVFHSKIPEQKVRNIEWIRGAQLSPGEIEPYPNCHAEHARRMALELAHCSRRMTLADYCTQYDRRCSLPAGTGMRVARLLMQSRVLMPDLNNASLATAPLASFRVSAPAGHPRLIGEN